MKKLFCTILLLLVLVPTVYAENNKKFKLRTIHNEEKAVKSVLTSQVRYANKTNFDKFISTYDANYLNEDGFNIETYSNLVKDLWNTYGNIKYGIKIKNVEVKDNIAEVSLVETSYANIPVSKTIDGVLKSTANSVYRLKKTDGKWKVIYDKVLDETTSMLYGDAINTDIKLSAPNEVEPDYEYTASLEFIPPKDTLAIASIARDKVEYPQNQPQEVFRKMPDDNILERLFVANSDNKNEYVIASIGFTKAAIEDLSIKLSLTGFGYQIIRVNVVQPQKESADVKD